MVLFEEVMRVVVYYCVGHLFQDIGKFSQIICPKPGELRQVRPAMKTERFRRFFQRMPVIDNCAPKKPTVRDNDGALVQRSNMGVVPAYASNIAFLSGLQFYVVAHFNLLSSAKLKPGKQIWSRIP